MNHICNAKPDRRKLNRHIVDILILNDPVGKMSGDGPENTNIGAHYYTGFYKIYGSTRNNLVISTSFSFNCHLKRKGGLQAV